MSARDRIRKVSRNRIEPETNLRSSSPIRRTEIKRRDETNYLYIFLFFYFAFVLIVLARGV